jgi:hypothetical protein
VHEFVAVVGAAVVGMATGASVVGAAGVVGGFACVVVVLGCVVAVARGTVVGAGRGGRVVRAGRAAFLVRGAGEPAVGLPFFTRASEESLPPPQAARERPASRAIARTRFVMWSD